MFAMSESDDDEEYLLGSSCSDTSISTEEYEYSESETLSCRTWMPLCLNNLPPAPARFPFQQPQVGATIDTSTFTQEKQYFELFFDDNLIHTITEETNRYAQQCIESQHLKPKSRSKRWVPTNDNEMKIFLLLHVLQGIIQKPDVSMFWSKKTCLETPFFRNVMSYDRFQMIRKYLHFVNNEEVDLETHPNAKLHKIWPIFQFLNAKFCSLYIPDRDVTVDESLMLYKGRLGWIQYMPLKRSRFGIKTFMLCESKTGYIFSSIIYTGKGTKLDSEYAHLGMSGQVVMSLMKPLLGKGYCLVTDNYYTSPLLADELVQQYSTDIYGTVRAIRKDLPLDFKKKNKER